MNCTQVLHVFGGHSIPQQSAMPVDLAMRLCLSQSLPLCHLQGVSPMKVLRPHLHTRDYRSPRASLQTAAPHSSSSSSSSSPERSETKSCVRRSSASPKKKHVVFADTKGLSLTAVRLYIPDNSFSTAKRADSSSPSTSSSPVRPQGLWPGSAGGKQQLCRLSLSFPQPTADIKTFQARLQEVLVQLESCSVTERSLSGTVRVCNVSFEKAVYVRVTFDSWRSHQDIPCSYLQQRYGGAETEVFAFDVPLPQNLDPSERVEFCVLFRPGSGAALRWDNNGGQNYCVCVEPEGAGYSKAQVQRHITTPRSLQRPPSWPRSGGTSLKSPLYPGLSHPSEAFISQSSG
ncbi:protein phosphatase 1 regulatory subunit 3C-B-like [Salvelinus fontinalis]|uniref:protein phosphatase 1 regulatory subunit 3C-B-like n=1 Tax=Salvelinus fontinalis TaxID=8038 RepID=UPI0024856043|nr:protein phosphatase 1 regulatory subunit 3C-B-like [Salvelinus fontinalis]